MKGCLQKIKIPTMKKHPLVQKADIFVFSILISLFYYLCTVQGFWRHDSWIYTTSELHEAIDGKWLADPLHSALGKIPPEISAPITVTIILIFLLNEAKRIAPLIYENNLWRISIVFSVFSSSVLSQLHWPNHALAASIPLLISIPLATFDQPIIKYLRTFIIAFGGFSILTQFAFFAPLCLIECKKSINTAKSNIQSKNKRVFIRLLIFLTIMSFALSIVIGIRFIYTTIDYIPQVVESRLTRSMSIDPTSIFEKIWSTSYNFGIQQWGYCAILILGIYIILFSIAAKSSINLFCKREKNYKEKSDQNVSNLLLCSCLLIMPIFASFASGTQAQRVAICWSGIAVVFMGLIENIRTKLIKKIICLSCLIACAYSSFIGISNFEAASTKTRELTDKVSLQIQGKSTNLFILKINDISDMNPEFIWGGWPSFAKNLSTNPRIFRLFDELQVEDYLILTPDFAFTPKDLSFNCRDLHKMRSYSSSHQIFNEYRTCLNPDLKNYVDLDSQI